MALETALGRAEAANAYTVRWFRPGDVSDVLALDRAVWNRRRDPEWFDWKYGENPYLDHVPVVVTESADSIVGARPLLPFRMRAGDRTELALQPTDTMVHPGHRRRGLFTRMNERIVERYADGEPAFLFNFPNEIALPGYLDLGWHVVGDRVTYYCVQNPAPFAASFGGGAARVLGRLAAPFARGYHRARARLVDRPDDVRTERRHGVPVELLARLYERRVPDRAHALRDEEFYRWRFSSPAWRRRTYVATRNGAPVAAIIARTRTTAGGITVTQFADVVPMIGGKRWAGALSRLFERIVADHAGSDLLSAVDSAIPHELLSAYGFRRDDSEPLIRLVTHDPVSVVRDLSGRGDATATLGDLSLASEDSWLLSFAERDTA